MQCNLPTFCKPLLKTVEIYYIYCVFTFRGKRICKKTSSFFKPNIEIGNRYLRNKGKLHVGCNCMYLTKNLNIRYIYTKNACGMAINIYNCIPLYNFRKSL